jgi:poly [ADP-ribose] polymerase 2/3/4
VPGLDGAAIRKEGKGVVAAATTTAVVDDTGDGVDKRNRNGAGDVEDDDNSDAPLDAAKLEGMGYRKLQGLAKAQGLAATGSKKELLERLLSTSSCAAAKGLLICLFLLFSVSIKKIKKTDG